MRNPSKEFMMPFIMALTTLLWGEAALETVTRGAMHAPTSLAELYLTLMGAYAGAGEVQKWLSKWPADPAEDPWLERAQKGGSFVALWLTLLIAVHLWQLHDPSVPMPADLKTITTGLVVIFFAKIASRHVRHSRKGIGGPDDGHAASARGALMALLTSAPEGLSIAEIESRLPTYTRRHLSRELSDMADEKLVVRPDSPRQPSAKYRLRH